MYFVAYFHTFFCYLKLLLLLLLVVDSLCTILLHMIEEIPRERDTKRGDHRRKGRFIKTNTSGFMYAAIANVYVV